MKNEIKVNFQHWKFEFEPNEISDYGSPFHSKSEVQIELLKIFKKRCLFPIFGSAPQFTW